MTDLTESWLPVTGYAGLYEVSSLGRVRSLDRVVLTRRGPRRYRGMILRPWLQSGGYPTVALSKNNISVRYPVHLLVLTEFVEACPPGQEARHGPTGKLDASISNLCWGSRSDNIRDRVRDGQGNRGERHPLAKLTAADVTEIRERVAAGESQVALAEAFHVTRANIHCIVQRKSWSHV